MRVWVTRDESADGPLCRALRAAGLDPVLEPVLTRRVVTDAAEDLRRLGPDDWLVLTSPFAVEAVAAEPARVPRVAVVAASSRDKAVARGFRVEMVGRAGTGKSLFSQLQAEVMRGKVCYPRSALVDPLEAWADVEVISPVLYETVPRAFDRRVAERVDVVAVASPSAVEAVGTIDLPYASIGSVTSAALRDRGVEPWVEALEPNFASLAGAIAEASRARR